MEKCQFCLTENTTFVCSECLDKELNELRHAVAVLSKRLRKLEMLEAV